jgi:ComF family protein
MAIDSRATGGRRGRRLAAQLGAAARWTSAAARYGTAQLVAATGKMQRATLDLVFPGACASCDAELTSNVPGKSAVPICDRCLDEMEFIAGPTCARCGAPIPRIGRSTDEPGADALRSDSCARCRGRKMWFDETIAAGLYSNRFREIVLRMKDTNGDALSLAIGALIWQQCGERLAAVGADVVAPIPLHWRRRLAHRTNSAAMLSEVLSRKLDLPFAERLLRRRKHTQPQSSVTPSQRWDNVRQAFSVRRGYHLNQAHVLLVDDILTTGATCSEAARALRKAGAARITVVVVARAIH